MEFVESIQAEGVELERKAMDEGTKAKTLLVVEIDKGNDKKDIAPGFGDSVIFGTNVTAAAPGSARGLYLVVADIEAARKELLGRGVKVSEPFHGGGDVHTGADEPHLVGSVRIGGPDLERRSYLSQASFNDPDGNG